MSKKIKYTLYFLFFLLLMFNLTKLASLICPKSFLIYLGTIETICIIFLLPIILYLINDYTKKIKLVLKTDSYSTKLNETLISQSYNPLFYQGKVLEGAKILTKQVTDVLDTDRCSIWLYNDDKSSIICQQLYVREEENWYVGGELKRNDYLPYFTHLQIDPIILAHNAEKHEATSCFKDTYLKPNNIKSMMDVPILYKGYVIGVFCVESHKLRTWITSEMNFARLVSALYSFSYSIKETKLAQDDLNDLENFVDTSVLVSKTDKYGKITYVNKKFEEVSGWKLHEVLGKNHNIVNSGRHSKDFWGQMYDTILVKKEIWNDIVTNRNKKGELYWVDSYIKADFDENGKLKGFRSLRYDVTGVIKQNIEIEKKNTYLEYAAKILRHDMHSGINTYIPRGVSSLQRRLTPEQMEELKISAPFKLIKEGLDHTQKVYRGVYEFTDLVKKGSTLRVDNCNLKQILENFLSSTSYKSQVFIYDLGEHEVNESLFCTAIDNLIRNGLKYNDSNKKIVTIKKEGDCITVQDNGRGLTQEEFLLLSRPYTRKVGQKEAGTGLGLNITIAILSEHGFKVSCEKNEIGTKIKINISKKIKND